MNLLESSKYLPSISIHLYDEVPEYIELMKSFELFSDPVSSPANLSFK